MDPITIAIAIALAGGLSQVGGKLLEKGVVEPALEPASDKLKTWLQRPLKKAEKDKALLNAVKAALEQAGAPTGDENDMQRWLKTVGLDRLTAKKNQALRRQLAQAVLALTDPAADPPDDLMIALGWPRPQRDQLAQLLTRLRAELYELDDWRPPIEYANSAAERGLLSGILARLSRLDRVFVETEAGQALRVVVEQQGLSQTEAAEIETRYRADLVRELKMHDFRGIVQVKRDTRVPLADIYLELGLLSLGSEEERRRAHEQLLALHEAERLVEEERRLQDRVTDALARAQRLVILGEPGAGKTISLCFIALMLAHGFGAARLGLDTPYLPLKVRLADFARALEQTPALSLDNFLLQVIAQAYASHPRLSDFLRLALEQGAGMILLDGLDEVGDDPVHGQSLRTRVVQRVQQFADRWCAAERPNRLVITSRLEGYWSEPLQDFEHVQLSPLRPPDEVREFLRRWYIAHEQAYDSTIPLTMAEQRAEQRIAELLPPVLEWPSVRRLATNPLLLTILALIHENLGRLPNRRIRLYEICAQTLIESWRQSQTGLPSALLAELGEETVIRIMAPLAYWLHESRPGGTASFQEWRERLRQILGEEGYKAEAKEIADRFLHHARYQAGLLAERGLGQFGFFHLTFEEYLAAREIARQRVDRRQEMLRAHWEDPRWHEVILLAAGQLGIVQGDKDPVSDFIEDLLKMEAQDPANAGRQVVLAGRALADIGPRSVTNRTRQWVLDALRETLQDLNPETKRPHQPPQTPVRTRYDAGEVLDELGWLPDDLNAWLRCERCAGDGRDLLAMKYPVTNAQFERFTLVAGGYDNPAYWGGEKSDGWQWRIDQNWSEPRYWDDPRFGRERRGYPVVGVSWYEAAAYAAWLTELLQRAQSPISNLPPEDLALIADLLKMGATSVRLPSEAEWEKIAGGGADQNRYPWDPPQGSATQDEAAGLARANTEEAKLEGTSPVGMYPLGASQPFGLMDLAGNIWEWTDSFASARCGSRGWHYPNLRGSGRGFRLVSPVVSVS
ncbi:MAG: SUMF1/EgtB/PvdO family nonheme iron enzyme [Chloroflexi bacterium]|nr:SUMF1/EgtB/PvdO family nonheme iron enzyme [Chloroflexota bacterium]